MGKLKIGFLGTSQLSFPGDKAGVFHRSVQELQALATEMDFELHVVTDTVIYEADAQRAVKELEDKGIDFLLVQNTSFSAGLLAPILARVKHAYLGLWAVPEGAEDGAVPLNSFCCMNMYASIIGHYLKEYHIPYKWFYGYAADENFRNRFRLTVRALRAICSIRQSKVALIGGIAPGFNDLYFDERKIEKALGGISINRVHEFSEIRDRALRYQTAELIPIMADMEQKACGVHQKAKPMLETSARVYLAYRDFIREYGYHGLAVSCWPKFQDDFNYSVCSVVAQLNDEGIVTSCEGDLPSAISMLILKYIANDETMLMDLSDFDQTDETVLMWHCGPASSRFADAKGYELGVNYHAMPHIPGQELSCIGVTRDMVFQAQHGTIMRLTGEGEKIFVMEGDFLDRSQKKSFFGSRGWMGNLKLNGEDIGVQDLVNTILVQRFQHHYPIVSGHYNGEVMELAAWLGLETVKCVPYRDYMQNPVT